VATELLVGDLLQHQLTSTTTNVHDAIEVKASNSG